MPEPSPTNGLPPKIIVQIIQDLVDTDFIELMRPHDLLYKRERWEHTFLQDWFCKQLQREHALRSGFNPPEPTQVTKPMNGSKLLAEYESDIYALLEASPAFGSQISRLAQTHQNVIATEKDEVNRKLLERFPQLADHGLEDFDSRSLQLARAPLDWRLEKLGYMEVLRVIEKVVSRAEEAAVQSSVTSMWCREIVEASKLNSSKEEEEYTAKKKYISMLLERKRKKSRREEFEHIARHSKFLYVLITTLCVIGIVMLGVYAYSTALAAICIFHTLILSVYILS